MVPIIGIVLLPDVSTEWMLRGMSTAAQAFGNSMLLSTGKKGPRPHLSLFHMRAALRSMRTIKGVVDQLELPDHIGGTCLSMRAVGGQWLFVQVDRVELVEQVQMPVVSQVAPRRSGSIDISWKMSPAQSAAHVQWGYPNVGEAWDTHFTFGYCGDASRVPASLRGDGMQLVNHQWHARAIAVVRIGHHGTAGEILHIRHLARPTI